jgi:microcystin-dependent protein
MTDLARFQRTVVDDTGAIIPSPTVTVRNQVSNALVSIFSDRAGASALSNPFTGTAEGLAAFHVAGGAYKVTATSGSFTAEWTWVGIGTAGELDAADALVPLGAILMWSGPIATIPNGWLLCDGTNGTPDLRDRFIIGARQDDAGAAKTNITGSLTQTGGSKDAIAVSHTHTASTNSTGAHTHSTPTAQGLYGAGAAATTGATNTTGVTGSAGAHEHTVTVASAGSSGTNANLPPYYALAFIMKS